MAKRKRSKRNSAGPAPAVRMVPERPGLAPSRHRGGGRESRGDGFCLLGVPPPAAACSMPAWWKRASRVRVLCRQK